MKYVILIVFDSTGPAAYKCQENKAVTFNWRTLLYTRLAVYIAGTSRYAHVLVLVI